MALVFMDFDGTLTRFDSFIPYCFTALIHRPWRIPALIRALGAGLRFAGKKIGRQQAKEALIEAFLGGATREEADRWNRMFLRHVFPLLIRKEMLARARWHQRQGDLVLIVSASPDIYLGPFVRKWGFDGIICTELEWKENRITGRIVGKNCQGEEKARLIKALFRKEDLSTASGYGNSEGDRAMLQTLGKGYYVRQRGVL